jgi:hypothetical protein
MTDFTDLMKRGHERYLAKNVYKRRFGRCMVCDVRALLLKYGELEDGSVIWVVCENCFMKLQKDEE